LQQRHSNRWRARRTHLLLCRRSSRLPPRPSPIKVNTRANETCENKSVNRRDCSEWKFSSLARMSLILTNPNQRRRLTRVTNELSLYEIRCAYHCSRSARSNSRGDSLAATRLQQCPVPTRRDEGYFTTINFRKPRNNGEPSSALASIR
jgi:hypothetical protein